MREPIIVYTIEAVANRLNIKPQSVKQAIVRLKNKGLPLVLGDFHFVLIGSNGYIALKQGEQVEIITK